MDEYAIPDTIQNMIHQTRREVPDVIEKVRDTGLPVEKINYFFGDQQGTGTCQTGSCRNAVM
ncbi:MAG: hypothetical protein ACLUD2_11010 [Clostridium sp.]